MIFLNTQPNTPNTDAAITAFLGYTSTEMVGYLLPLFVHPDELDLLQQVSEQIWQSSDKSIPLSFRFLSKGGSWHRFVGSGTNLLHIPSVAAILYTFQDIPQKKDETESKWNEVDHLVQFYENDAFLIDSMSDFIGTGLRTGNTCIVMATKAHLESLEERLKRDIDTDRMQGQYSPIDLDTIISMFKVDNLFDSVRCFEILDNLIMQAASYGHQVRIFGEMSSQLWAEGDRAGSIHLEDILNDLKKIHRFSLFCAFPIHLFERVTNETDLMKICNQHSQVIPTERYTQLSSRIERLRFICLLQQQAYSLANERVERKDILERLRLSERRYRYPFEASRDGILIVDLPTYMIIDANPFMEELLGYPYEQLLGQNLWEVGLLQAHETHLDNIHSLQEKQENLYKTVQLQTREGQPRYIEFVSILYQLNDEKVIQCNIRDITERKQTEEALLHLAAIVESSEDAIISKNLKGLITSWNSAAERMFGYRAEEIIGEPISLLIPPGQHDETRAIMEVLQQGQKRGNYDTTRVRKDGTLIDVSLAVSPIKNAIGQLIGTSGNYRDITFQKQLEQRTHRIVNTLLSIETMTQGSRNLRQIAQELGIFIHNILQPTYTSIVTFEPKTDIQHPLVTIGLSPEQLDLFWRICPGTHLAEVLGNEHFFARLQAGECVLLDLISCPAWEQYKAFGFRSYFLVSMHLGNELFGMLTIGHKDPDYRYSVAEQTLAQATAKLAVLVLERERLNREHAEGQAREFALRESNSRMDQFIGIVSHELRTPLTSLIGTVHLCAQSLEQRTDPSAFSREENARKNKRIATMLTQAEQQLWRLNRLVNDLLDISRIKANKLSLDLELCELVLIVSREVEEQLNMYPQRTILLTLPTEPVFVLADDDRIGQVITNYLTNALKYAVKVRPITVSLTLNKKFATVSVQDEGPGLPSTELEKIWERFYRVPDIKEQGGSRIGLGLGLYICREIIEQHHGQVGVQSEPGKGSTFWFTLPLVEQA